MKRFQYGRKALVALAVLTMSFVGLSGSAQATASGSVLLNTYGFKVGTKSYTFPGGYLRHSIEGPGYTAYSQIGSVTQASTSVFARYSRL